jgi:opacity protein-like surface antigen
LLIEEIFLYNYITTIFAVLATAVGSTQAADPAVATSTNDPMVMKIYPDGTKVVARWSEIGKAVDNGEKHGGSPRIIAYDSGKQSIVPLSHLPAAGTASPIVTQAPASSVSNSSFLSTENNGSLTGLSGFYFGPELGIAFQEDVNLQNVNIDTEILNAAVVGSAGGSLTMSAGIRFNFTAGYRPVDWFAVEFAPGIIWNKMSSYNLQLSGTIVGDAVSTTLPLDVEGGYFQVPLVVNFIFKIPTNSPWVPYIGGGIGASYTYMNWSRLSYAGVSADLSNVDGSCWSLAYQGIAGWDYKITDKVSLSLKYIFLGTGNQNFGGSFQNVDTKGSYSQNVMLNCTINY